MAATLLTDRMTLAWSYVIPWTLTNRNDGQGRHWSVSHRARQDAAMSVLGVPRRNPLDEPVIVVVTRLLGKGDRLWDQSSVLRGNWKQIEDALTKRGWWYDDSPKWISLVIGTQDATRRTEGPATLVEVFLGASAEKSDKRCEVSAPL